MCVVYSTLTAWLLLSGQKQQQQLVQTINGQHMFLTASPIDTTETLDTAAKPLGTSVRFRPNVGKS